MKISDFLHQTSYIRLLGRRCLDKTKGSIHLHSNCNAAWQIQYNFIRLKLSYLLLKALEYGCWNNDRYWKRTPNPRTLWMKWNEWNLDFYCDISISSRRFITVYNEWCEISQMSPVSSKEAGPEHRELRRPRELRSVIEYGRLLKVYETVMRSIATGCSRSFISPMILKIFLRWWYGWQPSVWQNVNFEIYTFSNRYHRIRSCSFHL